MNFYLILFLSLFTLTSSKLATAQVFHSIDIAPGFNSSDPVGMTAYNGKVYFSARNDFWVSDGTIAGTHIVQDSSAILKCHFPEGFILVNGKLLFYAADNTHGYELWATDGTSAGTHMVKDISPGYRSSYDFGTAVNFTVFNNRVYFSADDSIDGLELWTSDGTDSGTFMVKDINPGVAGSYPYAQSDNGITYKFSVFKNKLYFSADDGLHGRELWLTDGSAMGTTMVADIWPGPMGGGCHLMYPLDSVLIFSASDSVHGYELWATDGTTAGTTLVKDINAGSAGSDILGLMYLNGKIVFSALDGAINTGLWISDGTAQGTSKIKNVSGGGTGYALYARKLYYGVIDSNHLQLWSSDGTAAGTGLIKTIGPAVSNFPPQEFITYHDHLFFVSSSDTVDDDKLWVSDGTDAGTYIISPAGSTFYNPMINAASFCLSNGNLYFSASFDSIGQELWIYHVDSTASGVQSIDVNSTHIYPNPFNRTLTVKGLENGLYTIKLFDTNGQLCFVNSQFTEGKITYTLPDISSGIYIMEVQGQAMETRFKIVKQ